ncbi:MAG: signal peptide peptidase SppA [Sphingomonadaceae bacterium]
MRVVGVAWRLLVGVKDALVLLFMLLFFGLLYAALTARPTTGVVGSGALLMQLKGSIVEQPQVASPTELLSGNVPLKEYRLRDIVRALDTAATDDRIKLVVLDLDNFIGAGQVALGDVGEALDRVRAKKKVLAYATGYGDDAYALAAHASEVWLDPMGLALFSGPGGSRLYYKGLIDRLGVTAHVYRVGTYKAAVEPFTRTDQSPEAKAANQAIATALWDSWKAGIARARPKAQLAGYVADPVRATAGGDLAKAALAAGLVDKLGDRDSFDRYVAGLAGPGTPTTPFATVRLDRWIAANPAPSGGAIGVATVAGSIVDGEAEPGTAGGDTIAKIINRAVASGQYKALVLRVDSPGGSALASEKIRTALVQARAKGLPVVVSMANVAASGGYWVAMASDKVFAEPATITGSIGVFGIVPTFETALAKIGVTSDGVATTPLSGQPDIVGGTNAAFDTIIQQSIESTYGRFIGLVSTARKLPPARVDEIAQGRVWDGGAARQLGLVDGFGGIDEAVAEAARLAKLDPATATPVWLEKDRSWRQSLAEAFMSDSSEDGQESADLLSTLSRARMAMLAQAVDDARMLATGSAIQARCLECPMVGAAPVRRERLIDMVVAWLAR